MAAHPDKEAAMEKDGLPAGSHPLRLVTFDIDGTIAVGHGWRAIARHRGMTKAFDEAQTLFRSGRATEDDHLVRLLNFARGLPLQELEQILERTRHLAHLASLVGALHARGVKVALLTHNPGYVCRWYAERYGFDLWAGVLQRVRDGTIEGVQHVHVDKRDGLRMLLRATGALSAETAHLGDGPADARVFPFVATGIALNSYVPEVRRAADVTADTRDARDLLPLLHLGLRSRPRQLPTNGGVTSFGSFRLGRPHKS